MGFLSGTLLALSVGTVCLVGVVTGHGRLIDPPSRSSMWRYGYRNPPNYNDNQLYCGGVQVKTNTSFMTRSEIFYNVIWTFFEDLIWIFFEYLRYFIFEHFSVSEIFYIWTFFVWAGGLVNYFKIECATFPLTRVSLVFKYVIKPHVLKNW